MKLHKIQFQSREAIGVFLFELKMWGVKESRYATRSDYSVITKDVNVIDVCTETFASSMFMTEPVTSKQGINGE